MGKIFTLSADVKSVIANALDDLITELGQTCQLVYPPTWVFCVNCVFDPIGNKSSNHWKNGGPLSFGAGTTCPLCDGKGKHAQEVTENIVLACAWEPKHFIFPVPNLNLRVPYALLQTKGMMSDLPRLMKADHLILELPIEPYVRLAFTRASEPGDPSNIIQGRYCVLLWERKMQ